MRFRYYISPCISPYWNFAMEQFLFGFTDEKTAVLFLWQNDNTIVVGRNQEVFAECRAEEFIKFGGHIARRKSGGGAVYHDLGNLNFSIIESSSVTNETAYQKIVVKTIERFGITAEFSGRNDVINKDRKLSGNAVYSDGTRVCQHGTILVDSDIARMEHFLTPNQSKLRRHAVNSVRARVANLAEFDRSITVDRVRKAFIDVTKAEPLEITPDVREMDRLEGFFKSNSWIFGGKA